MQKRQALAPLVERAVVLRHGRVVHDGAPPRASSTPAGATHQHLHPPEPEACDSRPQAPQPDLSDTLHPARPAPPTPAGAPPPPHHPHEPGDGDSRPAGPETGLTDTLNPDLSAGHAPRTAS